MLTADNLSKGYGPQSLFESVSFKINPKERVGLVGRNGHGKTTLFRMITGIETADSGSITIPRGYRIGYVQQHLDFTENTVLSECIKELPEDEKHNHWQVEKFLAGLGFSQADMQRPPGQFSGGFQVRINLAKVLVSHPDMLLLDEPTNYLDITAIRWVEQFLLNWQGELMVITHDRSFMDRVVTHIIGIHRKKTRKVKGITANYYQQIAQDEEVYEKTRLNEERKKKDLEQFITRFRAKARLAGLAQSRVKTLEKMGQKQAIEPIKTLEFSFRYSAFPGKYMMSAENLAFGYHPQNRLIENLSFAVGARDRICIVGKNGKGKTTLLKLLAGFLNPTAGGITYNQNLEMGVFEQTNIATLIDSKTVEEEILLANPVVERQHARTISGIMMFEGDAALKKISVLSGGEKSRVLLGKLIVKPINLLLLDEPTNHLDMESGDALLSAIKDFPGAVILVTHNEMFLHEIANRLIVFSDSGAEVFEGTYSDFLERVGWGDEEVENKKPVSRRKNGEKAINRKELRRMRSEVIARRGSMLNPLEKEISDIENRIEHHEKTLHRCNIEMQEASRQKNGGRIGEISLAIHESENEIETLFTVLEEQHSVYEKQKALFDRQLDEIDKSIE